MVVIGSGPGAFFTVKQLIKQGASKIERIDILEKLSTPYGLIRFGVAPDHAEVKQVSNDFGKILQERPVDVQLFTNCDVENKQTLDRLRDSYDAVLIATGAQESKRLALQRLPAYTFSAQDFVLWYNGHPLKRDLVLPDQPRNVSIVGHGNVALDVARMLSKSEPELRPLLNSGLLFDQAYEWLKKRQSLDGKKSVSVFGRRGYLDAAFTNKEFRELTNISDAVCRVDPSELEFSVSHMAKIPDFDRAKARGLSILSKCVEAKSQTGVSNEIFLRFFSTPIQYIGDPVKELIVKHRTGALEHVPTDLGIESIGFKVSDQFGFKIDENTGGISHDGRGRVSGLPRVYVAGWAKRGPKGVIAANLPCSMETADAMMEDISKEGNKLDLKKPLEFTNRYIPGVS